VSSEKKNATVLDAQEQPQTGSKPRSGDWTAKILCLLIAFVTWFYVMQVDSPEYSETFHSVDVSLTNTAVLEGEQGLSVYSGYGSTVDITVIGQKSLIDKLASDDFLVTADLSDIKTPGMHSVPVHVDLPTGISMEGLSQNTIQVYVDEKSNIVTEIRAKLTSFTIESHLQMGELRPEYETVVVTGPKTALEDIAYAEVSLALGNITSAMKASGELVLMDKAGNPVSNPYLRMARTEVTVEIPVYTSKTVPLSVGCKYGYYNENNVQITVDPPQLALRGDPAILDGMDVLEIVTLDEKAIVGNVTQQVALDLPEGLEVINGAESVLVTVKHVNTYTKFFTVTDIDVTGAVGIDYQILTPSLSLMVRGSIEELGKLKNSDITAIVDLSGYSADTSGIITKTASVLIDSANAKNVYEVGEYQVQVKLN